MTNDNPAEDPPVDLAEPPAPKKSRAGRNLPAAIGVGLALGAVIVLSLFLYLAASGLRLIHLPVHASWLNQIEIVFSIIQRKVVTPNDFYHLDQITERLAAFEDRYNMLAEPFDWTFTREDLNDLLQRIAAHDSLAPAPLPVAA